MSTPNGARRRRARQSAGTAFVGLLLSSAAALAAGEPLKVCADPDNLPFSSSAGTPKGFYIDLGDRLAAALERVPEVVWQPSYLGKRAVRGTLLARQCDLYIGLPADGGFMAPQVVMSAPFAAFQYALVLPPGSRIATLSDLKGRRVAVQFASPPQSLLASVDGIQGVTVLSPEDGMRALADGRADAAYLWGPSAGYLNKSAYAGSYQVVPTDGPAMSWNVAIGFRRADAELRAAAPCSTPPAPTATAPMRHRPKSASTCAGCTSATPRRSTRCLRPRCRTAAPTRACRSGRA